MLRSSNTAEVIDILLRDKTSGNPFASGPEGGAMENFYIDQGKLVRTSYMPPVMTSASNSSVWAIKEFNFTRDNAAEQQLLIFKSDGKVYRRRGGEEVEIYPENDIPSSGETPDDGYAGTGATTAGNGTDWSNSTNITGAANSTYATSQITGNTNTGATIVGDGANGGGGSIAWTSPSNITALDSVMATWSQPTPATTATSEYLHATGLGFSIPVDATIVGIVAEINISGGAGSNGQDTSVLIIKGGSRTGTDKATTAYLPSTQTWITYGGVTDLWGTTWTASDINAADFGFAYQLTSDAGVVTATADAVRITVYYTIYNTDLLKATNYGLSVAGAISGITVKITGKLTVSSGSADSSITLQLLQAGALLGNSKSQSFNSTSDVTLTFGSATDLWGGSWTSTDVNLSTFGVAVYCSKSASPSGSVTFNIDSVQIFVAVSGTEATTTSLFTRKPTIAQIANRLHVSDGRIYRIYDGWNWFVGGLTAPTGFDSADTSLTGTGLTGTYSVAVTAVHIRTNNGITQRVHESNSSDLASETPSNQSIRVDISGVTFPARATHWSVYMSEVSDSGVLRRVTTLPITTTTYDISSEPDPASPTVPERNDPVQPTRILTQWKNRLAGRAETNPDQLWFTGFGEINGLSNGAGEECFPGRLGSNSLSDLINEWQIPDGGQPLQCAVYHGEVLWCFTDRNGFYIQGDGALLDDTGLRDFRPQKGLQFGAAGPTAALSTPFGLAVMSHEHKLWLWRQGPEAEDIGKDIQNRLDDLTETQLNNIEMVYWSGEGWDWLMLPLPDRIAVFDFSLTSDKSPLGGWFSIGSMDGLPQPTAFSIYHPNKKFLLVGCADGSTHQLATLCQPAHLGLMKFGETYFGSTVQDSPISVARTGPVSGKDGQWGDWKYIQLYQRGHTDETSITASDPVVNIYLDQPDPAAPDSSVTLTTSTVNGSNERRAWIKPTANASSAGALARSVHVEMKYTSTDNDGATRPQLVNNEILRLSVTNQPKGNLTQ